MAPDADPYRTLGLARGAPLAEVKRAYRRLAKANHPDAAGESALPRFLAIQTAYDQIAGPDAGPSATSGRANGPKRPWDAQPDRADATHRAYGGRSRRTRPTGPRPAEPAAGESRRESREPREPREPKLATMGSTSYDGVDSEPFEPDWGGASWYGTTSGTYWTLNPKEYADPRKHGPEYQARARRAAETAAASATMDGEAPDQAAPPTHTTSSWWDATAAEPTSDQTASTADQASVRSSPASHSPAESPAESPAPEMRPNGIAEAADTAHAAPSIWDAARWLETGSGGVAGRVIRAVAGWAPIALGIGWLAGEITGCARFSAECDASSAPIAWFAQLVILAVLLIVPRLAAAASVATVGTIAAAVPGSLLLTSMGGAADLASGRAALGGLLVIGWVVGIAIGIGREVRHPVGKGNRPVS